MSIFILNVDSGCANYGRTASAEASSGISFRSFRGNVANRFEEWWSGDSTFYVAGEPVSEDSTHNIVAALDVSGDTIGLFLIDGVLRVTDTNVSGLTACQSTLIRLGARAYDADYKSTAKFGFFAVLYLSGVAVVNQAFAESLSVAIHGAVFSPDAIRAAIMAVDVNITGVFWKLNEAGESGSFDSQTVVRYDITDGSVDAANGGTSSAAGCDGTIIYTETPPGLANLKLWMKLNDIIIRGGDDPQVVINEVGDNGAFHNTPEGDQDYVSVNSGNPPYLNGAFEYSEDIQDQRIIVPHSAGITFTSEDFSIVMWVNVRMFGLYDYFIAKGFWGEDGWIVQELANRQLQFATNQVLTAQTTTTAINAWTDGVWWLLGITRAGAVVKIYKNAVDITDTSGNHIDTVNCTDPLTIGANSEDLNNRTLDGKQDNVMIFNKVLTQDNFNWLYNGGNGRESPVITVPPRLRAIEKY